MGNSAVVQQRPHSIGVVPRQGPRITVPFALTSVLSGTGNTGTVAVGDMTMEDAEGIINNIQTMFVDASNTQFGGRLYFLETQQTIFIPPASQGYYPIAVGPQTQMTWTAWDGAGTDSGQVTITIQFLNVQVSGTVWTAIGYPT